MPTTSINERIEVRGSFMASLRLSEVASLVMRIEHFPRTHLVRVISHRLVCRLCGTRTGDRVATSDNCNGLYGEFKQSSCGHRVG